MLEFNSLVSSLISIWNFQNLGILIRNHYYIVTEIFVDLISQSSFTTQRYCLFICFSHKTSRSFFFQGEDLTDDAVFTRHDKCEYEEKKRFLSYLKLPIGHGRNRSHKRTDSRAESSGANTPDRMSPHNIDQQDSMNSPMASPPATPLGIQVDENMPLPSIAVMRRRTMSQSKFLRDRELKEETMCNTADIIEVINVIVNTKK